MMYHFDFYRIEDPSEALDLGLEEYLESGAWNMMEWPENIEGLVHPPYMRIEITTNDNGSRTLEISPVN
jgi:tRNA threonylcarbamoyladenosine biosynthesis protein TsaE